MKLKKRAALLCRVSTSNQDNLRQVTELTELAKSRGYVVEPHDIYQDKISGFTRYQDRPALSRLFQNIKKGVKYDMVFVMEISRISRKVDEGQRILLEFSDLGVPVYVKNINQCTHHDDGKRNPFFNIVYTLLQEFAASEAEYIKERSISGLRQKVKDGHAGGGVLLPYGYKRSETKMLVVDEEEFKRTVLEVMRQPMEERRVTISRAKVAIDFPASFMLIASMNPCPCGYYNHPDRQCTCAPGTVQKYLNKVSGPLLVRSTLQCNDINFVKKAV